MLTINTLMTNIVLIVVFILLAVLAFYRGRSMLFGIIASFYPAIVVYNSFPYTENLILFKANSQEIFLSHLLIFLIIFAPIYFAFRRITHSQGSRSGVNGVIDAVLLSLSAIALSVVLTLHVLPTRDIYNLTTGAIQFFDSPLGYFLSLALPLGVIYHLSGREF